MAIETIEENCAVFKNPNRGNVKKLFASWYSKYLFARRYLLNALGWRMPWLLSPLPQVIVIRPTYRCNLKCKHCFVKDRNHQELLADDWIKILDLLKDWLGCCQIFISGGEPLLFPDIDRVIAHAVSNNLNVTLNTNGTLLDEKSLRGFIRTGLRDVWISLDGVEGVNDFVRGGGVYCKVTAAIALLKPHMRITIQTTIMKSNMDGIFDLLDYCRLNGLQISFQCFCVATGNEHLRPDSEEKIRCFFAKLVQYKRNNVDIIFDSFAYLSLLENFYLGRLLRKACACRRSRQDLRVYPNGDLGICLYFPLIGNILRDDMKVIWRSKEVVRLRRRIEACTREHEHVRCYYQAGLFDRARRFFTTFS